MGRAKKVSRRFNDVDFCISDLLDNGVTQEYNHPTITEYEKRLRGTTNGNFIDPDSFFVIASFLDPETVCSLRQVCLHWHKFFSSNSIWQPLFQFYFDPNASDRDVDTLTTNDPSSYWFFRYSHTMAKIPSVTTDDLPETYKDYDDEDAIIVDDTNKETDWVHEITSIKYSISKITCDSELVTKNTHKVAVILNLLKLYNNYCPKISDIIRIGYRKDNKQMPLGRLCYALLNGKEEELHAIDPKDVHFVEVPDFEDDDNERFFNNPKSNYVSNGYEGADDSVEKIDDKRQANISIGMCPDVVGEFVPFVHYLDVGGQPDIPTIYLDSEHTLDKKVDFDSMYYWSTSENGWAPAFFNASFTWFRYMHVVSGFDATKGELVTMFVKGGTAVF